MAASGVGRMEEIDRAIATTEIVPKDCSRAEPPLARERRISALYLGEACRDLDENATIADGQVGGPRTQRCS